MPSKEAELLAAEFVMLAERPTKNASVRDRMLKHLTRQMVQHLGSITAAQDLIEKTKSSMALLTPAEVDSGSLD